VVSTSGGLGGQGALRVIKCICEYFHERLDCHLAVAAPPTSLSSHACEGGRFPVISRKLFLGLALLAWIALSGALAFYLVMIHTGLPSDEEMIADFRAHKADIEELVWRYRTYSPPREPKSGETREEWLKRLPPSAFNWTKQHADTPELMRKAGVHGIIHSSHTRWLPDPYSEESAKKLAGLVKNREFDALRWHSVVIVKFSPMGNYDDGIRHIPACKDFYFIPEIPRIEGGWIIGPARRNSPPSRYGRILPSLDTFDRFPHPWRAFECVYRQIEPHWFLRMCNGN
jgi:hypothetical protein